MRWWFLTLLVACAPEDVTDPTLTTDGGVDPADRSVDPPAPFALFELFTSEGCYSCPPADEVTSELAHRQRKSGDRLFVLAWHVDYWDYLGWQDPFGKAAYAERQYAYADHLGSNVYTPQLVVNGQEEFVGSDRDAVDAAEADWLGTDAPVGVTLWPGAETDDGVVVDWAVDGAPASAELHIVLVEHGLTTDVPSGENAGERLHHDNVVRKWITVPLDVAEGTATVAIPKPVDRGLASLVGFVQHPRNLKVTGATLTSLATVE